MTELAKYEAAERALAAAEAVDEVLEIRSQAEAWRAYAKQAKNRDLEIKAARIRFRAERRLGEMLLASDLSKGGRPAEKTCSDPEQVFEAPPTLAEVGIDRKLSSRTQRLASMDADEFEQALARHAEEMRAGQGRVAMDLLKIGAEEKGRAHRRNLAQVLSEQSAALPAGRVYPCAYIDPPWKREGGIGNRAYENHYPTMTWPEILAYLRAAREALLPDSWAFFWIPRAHLLALVEIELEVTVAETGEVVIAKVDMPLGWAVGQALGMDSYSTCFVWTKTDADHPDDSGSGLIAWDQDELLLLFKRGRGLPKPAGSEKFGSNHRERAREHSRKPDFYRHMIATMVGCDQDGRPLPVLEMFARVDAKHPLPPGWDACGNQAGATPALIDLDQSESSFAAELPSAGETVTAAADATSARANAAAAVTDNSEPAFPPTEWADLQLFLSRAPVEQLAPIAPGYLRRGLVQEWLGEWRLTKAGEIRIGVLERERAERQALGRRVLEADDFDLWQQLAAIAGREPLEGEIVRHLVGVDLAHVTTMRVLLTECGEQRFAALDEAVDAHAPVMALAPTPIAAKQLDLEELLQREGTS